MTRTLLLAALVLLVAILLIDMGRLIALDLLRNPESRTLRMLAAGLLIVALYCAVKAYQAYRPASLFIFTFMAGVMMIAVLYPLTGDWLHLLDGRHADTPQTREEW